MVRVPAIGFDLSLLTVLTVPYRFSTVLSYYFHHYKTIDSWLTKFAMRCCLVTSCKNCFFIVLNFFKPVKSDWNIILLAEVIPYISIWEVFQFLCISKAACKVKVIFKVFQVSGWFQHGFQECFLCITSTDNPSSDTIDGRVEEIKSDNGFIK